MEEFFAENIRVVNALVVMDVADQRVVSGVLDRSISFTFVGKKLNGHSGTVGVENTELINIHPMAQGCDDPENQSWNSHAEDHSFGPWYREDVQKRVADAEVSVQSDADHDVGRERLDGRDQEHVKLAGRVVNEVVFDQFEDNGVGNGHQAGEKVNT